MWGVYSRVSKHFYFSFTYSQIWLSPLVDDRAGHKNSKKKRGGGGTCDSQFFFFGEFTQFGECFFFGENQTKHENLMVLKIFFSFFSIFEKNLNFRLKVFTT